MGVRGGGENKEKNTLSQLSSLTTYLDKSADSKVRFAKIILSIVNKSSIFALLFLQQYDYYFVIENEML